MKSTSRIPLGSDRNTDAELLARVASGEVSALGSLYDRYAPALLRFARRIDLQDSEDLVQTTFLRVTQVAGRYDGRNASARAWLFAILTKVAQERGRSLRRFARALGRLAALPRSHSVPFVDRAPDVDRALSRLSTPKRVVLLLAEVEGFTCEEIATVLGVPVGTVWTRLHHARKELRSFDAEVSQ